MTPTVRLLLGTTIGCSLSLNFLPRAAGAATGPKPTTIIRASGRITTAVDRYRAVLGPNNGGEPTTAATGRREINWDGVPEALASPNALPGDFFNAAVAPRARGAVLTTPGSNVAVSAGNTNPDYTRPRFGNLNAAYGAQFKTFSGERLFSPIGSNIVELTFMVPGTASPAAVRGFGAVYTDIDRRENTAFEYFDAQGRSLGKYAVPAAPSGLSFLGVAFKHAIVAKVRIEYGSGPLGPDETGGYDAAVMDDFIYGEPQPI